MIAELSGLGDLQHTLDLIHHVDAASLDRLRNVDRCVRTRLSPDFIRVHGRVERMQCHLRVAEPRGDLCDLRAVAPVEVLHGREDLDGRDSRRPDSIEPDSGEPMIDEEVGGKDLFHAP